MFSNLLTTCASLEFVSHTFGSQRLLSQALLAEAIGWIVCQCTEERSAVGAQSRRCHDNSNPSYSPICTSNPTLRPGCTHGRCSTVASLPKQIFYSRASDDDADNDDDDEDDDEEARGRSWNEDEMPPDKSRDVKKRAPNKALSFAPSSSCLPIFAPTTATTTVTTVAGVSHGSGEIKGVSFHIDSRDLSFNLFYIQRSTSFLTAMSSIFRGEAIGVKN